MYTFSSQKAWKRVIQHRYIWTVQLKVATKNPFQYKIMTNPVLNDIIGFKLIQHSE